MEETEPSVLENNEHEDKSHIFKMSKIPTINKHRRISMDSAFNLTL